MGWIALVGVLLCLAYFLGTITGRMRRHRRFVKILRETVVETDRFFDLKSPSEEEKHEFITRWYAVIEASGSVLQEVCGLLRTQK